VTQFDFAFSEPLTVPQSLPANRLFPQFLFKILHIVGNTTLNTVGLFRQPKATLGLTSNLQMRTEKAQEPSLQPWEDVFRVMEARMAKAVEMAERAQKMRETAKAMYQRAIQMQGTRIRWS
jgi:hypothetical protein